MGGGLTELADSLPNPDHLPWHCTGSRKAALRADFESFLPTSFQERRAARRQARRVHPLDSSCSSCPVRLSFINLITLRPFAIYWPRYHIDAQVRSYKQHGTISLRPRSHEPHLSAYEFSIMSRERRCKGKRRSSRRPDPARHEPAVSRQAICWPLAR